MTDQPPDEQRYRWRETALGILALALVLCLIREVYLSAHLVSNSAR
jgi:hypothetical protein